MMEGYESTKVVSLGGLNSNVNHIQLSDNEPGSAVDLLNFESSLYGGYRRLSGYQPLLEGAPTVDPTNAEGRILTVAIFGSSILAARKQKADNTYDFYISSGTTWTKLPTAFSKSSINVTRIRWATFNFKGVQKIIFVDGVNFGMIYDGTTWTQIKSTNTGASYILAGGNQAIDAPQTVEIFKNTIWMSQDNVIVYSAPLSDFDWTAASGAGQMPTGYTTNMIKIFRDKLYVFGTNNIKAVNLDTSGTTAVFVINEVTANIGCLAPDSVIEIAGMLVFLSQDGFRPIAGTDRIGDVEMETISRKIQPLIIDNINNNNLNEITSVLVRGKTQLRFFFNSPNTAVVDTYGIIGCIRGESDSMSWEWGQLKGIRAACTTSRYIGAVEYVLHGDYDGYVYRQEVGNSFAGAPVPAVYTTPFLDFGDANIRKTMHTIKLFVRPEGNMNLTTRLVYDWMDPGKLNPSGYSISTTLQGTISIWGTAIYDSSSYSNLNVPVLISNVEGSGFSTQISYATYDINPSYTIQGALYIFNAEGRK